MGGEDSERWVEEKEVTGVKKGETEAEKLIREGEEEIAEMAKTMEAKMLKLEIFKKARYEGENPATPQTPAPTDTVATATEALLQSIREMKYLVPRAMLTNGAIDEAR